MDAKTQAQARAAAGVVPATALGGQPARAAARAGLRSVVPRAYVAATQPIGPREVLAALVTSAPDRYVLVADTALWLYGVATQPSTVQAAVAHTTRLTLPAEVDVRRVAPAVLDGERIIGGHRVVSLEIAVVQAAYAKPMSQVMALLEKVLRSRRTTPARLRAVCRRGLRGSAAVQRGLSELDGGSLDRAVRLLVGALQARGVQDLETEVRFVSSAGASCYADALHRPSATVLEVDGFTSHSEFARFRADRRRDRWLQADHGLVTLRIAVGEITADLDGVADEVVALLAQRSRRPAA